MAQFVSDDFAGTEGAELSAYNSAWSKITGTTGNVEIASGRARASSTTTAGYYHSGTPASADYTVSVDGYQAGGISAIGPVARCSTSAATFYHYRINSDGNVTQLYKFVSGTATLLGSTSGRTTSNGVTYALKLEVIGSAIKGYWDGSGSADISATDTAITAAGKAGLRWLLTTTPTDTATWHADNFSADDVGAGASVSVPAGALSLNGYAPTVTATANQTVAVPAGSLTLTAYAPTVIEGDNQTVSVPAGSLTLTGYAPDVQVAATGTTVQVPVASLILTGFAPTVVAPATITIPAGSLTLTALAPTVIVRADQVVAVPLGELNLTGYAPLVATTGIVSVPAGALTLTGYAPTVLNGEEAPEAPRMVGAGRPRRTRQRVVVEIDGEDFIAESPEEAQAILDQAKEAAEEKAKVAIERATKAKNRPTRKVMADARKALELPAISAPELDGYAEEISRQIEDIYRSAIQTIEVAALLRKRELEEEDDEDILMLI